MTSIRSLVQSLLFSCIVASVCFAQEKLEPVLVDEFGVLGCDETLARLDSFFGDMNASPASVAVIVISGPVDLKHQLAFRQILIAEHSRWRAFDVSRIRFVWSMTDGKIQHHFWRVPPGASPPAVENIDMSYTIPNTVKPFLMGDETKIGDQICPPVDDEKIFADFLKANPSARGNIVVRDNAARQASREARRIVRKFNRKYRIATSRLRTFTAKFERPSNWDQAVVEYWYLP